MPDIGSFDAWGMIEFMNALDKILHQERVVFSRWGDGEWTAILGLRPGKANTDGHHYFTDMGESLARVLESNPTYTLGLQPLVNKTMMDTVGPWLEKRGLSFEWDNADCFHKSAQAQDWSFLDAFRSRDFTYVGPPHLKPLFDRGVYIEIPRSNCWLSTPESISRILSNMTDCVGFSASMAANVWIDRIHKERPKATLIDFGSVFDPLVGVKSRGYMRT